MDLTLPTTGGTSHPLIVLLHGFGNNKHEWESTTAEGDGADKYHWNSVWFAQHGYYVLTYTARGFRDDGPYDSYQPNSPGGTSVDLSPPASAGTLHLKSRDFEVRDTQWLAALVAATHHDVDRRAVAVSGGSYGGGEAWLQASEPVWSWPHERSAELPVLQLQVAVPKYPWTDLAYSLAPNGHGGGPSRSDIYESSQGEPQSDTGSGNPIGVPKESFLTALFALGDEKGVFEEGQTNPAFTGEEGPINVPAWQTRVTGQGDPYDAGGVDDPLVATVRRGLTEFRSAYYQDERWSSQSGGRKVAVFSIQGWSDDLFEAVESFRMFKYLKRLDPRWPVAVAVADVGHSRAQNRPDDWQYLNNQANQWLQSNINGSSDQETNVTSLQSTCPNDPGGDVQQTAISASTPEGLSAGTLSVDYAPGGALSSDGGTTDPDGPHTDPVVGDVITSGEPCRESSSDSWPGRWTGISQPLDSKQTYVGLGSVRIPYTLAGTTAQIDARVWDIPAAGGPALLVTRGTYRLDVPYDGTTGTLTLPLYGNEWVWRPGDKIRLDLTQVDAASFRPNNSPSAISFDSPRLVLPTRDSGDVTITGTGD